MIRIATYNIQYGMGADGRFDLDRIVAVIGDLEIVGLQEVEAHWDRSGNRDLPALISEKMPDHHVAWGPNINVLKGGGHAPGGPREPRRQFGNMILSRYPILSTRNHLLPRYGAASLLDMQRGALEATVAVPGGAIRVYCTHLCHLSDEQRALQLHRLRQIIADAPAEGPPLSGIHDRDPSWSSESPLPPVPTESIVLGDFNCTPDSASYALLAGAASERRGRMVRQDSLLDAWDVAAQRVGLPVAGGGVDGATRYASYPPQAGAGRRLDFCFLPPRLAGQVLEARVLTDADGSDHLPLIVTLRSL